MNKTTINIGIAEKDRKKIADGLSRMLADTYTLYLKTHNFHWNVTGPMFQTLHLMFMSNMRGELSWQAPRSAPEDPLPSWPRGSPRDCGRFAHRAVHAGK